MVVELELSKITADRDFYQPRTHLNVDTVSQYSEDMLAGIQFPPVVVYFDGEVYRLSQGFHRVHAAEEAGFGTILADVREGGIWDALWDAAGSNREHDASGLRRSNNDKDRAVRMALQHPDAKNMSNYDIAKHCGVGESMVRARRKPIYVLNVDKPAIVNGDRIVTRGGTTYTMKTGNIGQPEPAFVRAEVERPQTSDDYKLDPDKNFPVASDELFQLAPQNIASEVKPASKSHPTFNATNEMVDWARWTWNPVTGCEHNCVYCYARDIANRFYPEKFEPTFRPERLEAPRHTNRPHVADAETDPVRATSWRNVFVCSMADLFGRWVPDQWIEDVFVSCRKSPEWNYLFLTKFPQRYVGLDFPETAWVGTSVDEQKRVANAEKAFAKINVPIKWLSVEPMRERIVFGDLSMFNWVVIGGQSRSSEAPEFHPEPWWVIDLAWKARESGCKVYLKPNTFRDTGWQIKEYPY